MTRPTVPPPLRAAPFAVAAADEWIPRRRLRTSAYQHLARGAWWTADGTVDFGRRLQAFRAVLPERVVTCGLAAAWELGTCVARTDDLVVVNLLPRGAARSRAGLRVRAQQLPPQHVLEGPAGWCTTPARTVVDLLRDLPPVRAVPVADALLRATRTAVEELVPVLAACAGGRGTRRAHALVPQLDPGSESPRESLLRLLVLDAGLPRPVSQYEVRTPAGAFVARLDLAWPGQRVAVEYDGAHHREARQHSADLARHNRLRAQGWTVLQVDAQVLARPAALLAQLRHLLGGDGTA
ncbi:endonuclease domain-containing protein [Thalassiella azotivora]